MIFNTCCVHRTGLDAPPDPALRVYWVMPDAKRLPDDYELIDFVFELETLEDAWLYLPDGQSYAPYGHDCTGWSDGVNTFEQGQPLYLTEFHVQQDFRGKSFLILTAQWAPS